ncbi:MAG: KpsF/GutQ family sugar-phosphate isomerase [Chitinophagia bacterium]
MTNPLLSIAREAILLESAALLQMAANLNESFEQAAQEIQNSGGRAVVSGIGKSAIIAQKIVATLNSTGTPSLFMHAADAIHGDLGMVQPGDIVLLISKSGESPEIKALVPLIKKAPFRLIGITGQPDSFLAKESDHVLNTWVEKEACPHNLAPTTSTTAQLVMGDALAICLMHLSGFTGNDFARFHPGGNLGKRLSLLAGDLAAAHEQPRVLPSASLKAVIVEITEKRLGVTAVVDEKEAVIGIITDGDLRRMLEKKDDIRNIQASEIMSPHPKTISTNALAAQALEEMRTHDISQLIVAENGQYRGIVHLHDLIKEGII